VVLGVRLRRLSRVVRCVVRVAVRGVCVVRGLLVLSRFVVPGRFLVMSRRVLVMLGGLAVMLGCLLGHESLLSRVG
jgi:hypothetical protein